MSRDESFSINPIKIKGYRFTGWALDYHTVSSKYDRAGRYYITDRSELGEALYKFKYKKRFWLAEKIAQTAADFLVEMNVNENIDLIITIPPARFRLLFQPVNMLARRIGRMLDKPVETGLLKRKKKIPQVKSIEDKTERAKLMRGLFSVRSSRISSENILLFDDLYRSGTTLKEAARALISEGGINRIFVLTITKTRVRR